LYGPQTQQRYVEDGHEPTTQDPVEKLRPMTTIKIRLAPKSSRDHILGPYGDAIKIAITSPPVDGKANAHLIKFLSKRLKVAKSAICIVSGELSRDKVLQIDGLSQAEVMEKLLP
jgi:uncharacterized protein (TIGR00251 family)